MRYAILSKCGNTVFMTKSEIEHYLQILEMVWNAEKAVYGDLNKFLFTIEIECPVEVDLIGWLRVCFGKSKLYNHLSCLVRPELPCKSNNKVN